MTKRLLTLFFAIGFASVCAVQAQSPTPGESPAGAPAKHRTHKKAETTASTSGTTASPAPGEAPAGAPKTKRGGKKAEAGRAAASPTAAPVASPAAAPKAKGGRKK